MRIYLKPRDNRWAAFLCKDNDRFGYEILGPNDEYRRVQVSLPGQFDDSTEYAGVSIDLFLKSGCEIAAEDIVAAEINIIPVKDVL